MKILLVHPDDSLEENTQSAAAWAATQWDFVVDLGWSGRHFYSLQTERLGFRVFSIYDVLDHDQHRSRICEALAIGRNELVDSESVDWWEAYSGVPFAYLEQLISLSALAEQIPAHAHVFATRPHFAVAALSLLLHRPIQTFSESRKNGLQQLSRRYWKAATALRPSQLAEIAFDKWDADYRFRRRFAPSPRKSSAPVILLPSAYINVSRAQLAYARMLPHRRFLLVVTRSSGRLRNLPGNIELRSLASYAPRVLSSTEQEYARLKSRWHQMLNDRFENAPVLQLARKLHAFDGFGRFLRIGLRIRDAWREVFAQEPVTAVLSADEHNPFTRLPIVLAQSRHLRTVFCDHGALNLSIGIHPPASGTYLMKGGMARDYSVASCGLSPEKVVIGGPATPSRPWPPPAPMHTPMSTPINKDWIVFYSEAYELYSGRAQVFYAELLPELCSLAAHTNRKVVVKLHPFESLRMRKRLVSRVVPPEHRNLVELRSGPITPDLFARAWCSVTVESSVAVESTINGVPCFLCGWFDASWYEYGKQYAKFSAGYTLDCPRRIREIPRLLQQIRITEATVQGLESPISPGHLDSVLGNV